RSGGPRSQGQRLENVGSSAEAAINQYRRFSAYRIIRIDAGMSIDAAKPDERRSPWFEWRAPHRQRRKQDLWSRLVREPGSPPGFPPECGGSREISLASKDRRLRDRRE